MFQSVSPGARSDTIVLIVLFQTFRHSCFKVNKGREPLTVELWIFGSCDAMDSFEIRGFMIIFEEEAFIVIPQTLLEGVWILPKLPWRQKFTDQL